MPYHHIRMGQRYDNNLDPFSLYIPPRKYFKITIFNEFSYANIALLFTKNKIQNFNYSLPLGV